MYQRPTIPRKWSLLTGIATALALLSVVACATPANPATPAATDKPQVVLPTAGGVYKIVARNSGLVLTVKDSGTSEGTVVQQAAYVDAAHQQWRVTALSNGQFKFIDVQSGCSFDIAGGPSATAGANLQIWGSYDTSNQKFTLTATDSGFFRISPVSSPGSCLQVAGNALTEGADIKMYPYKAGTSQQWSFQPVIEAVSVPPAVANGVYQIVNRHSAQAMMPANSGTDSGTAVLQVTDNGADAQLWSLTSLGNGQYKVVGALSAKVLEVAGTSTADGTPTDLGDYSGKTNQRFILTAIDQGYFRISPANATGSSLQVGDAVSGSPVKLSATTGADSQQWTFKTLVTPVTPGASGTKNRVIVLTDIGSDPDDTQSLVRTLLYANDMDLEGLVHSTSCWWPTASQAGIDKIAKVVTAYGKVRDNLLVHDSSYPTFASVLNLVKLGQTSYGMAGVGAGKDTDGSNLIIAAVDRDDPRPVWVSVWGGVSTLAQALWKVRSTRTADQLAQFVSKLRVYDIAGQDDAGAWIAHTFPGLFYVCSVGQFYGMGTQGDTSYCNAGWLTTNVQSHGFLGAEYPNVAWTMEGDTPSFLYLIPNGLHDPMVLDQGGWGGRFNATRTLGPRSTQNSGLVATAQAVYDGYLMYTEASDDGNPAKPVYRWRVGYQNDMAARMDWTQAATYGAANHNPIAVVNADTTKAILQVSAAAGTTVNLDATGSSDPDGNTLSYSWWFYNEPGTYHGSVVIQNPASAQATVTVPADAPGKTLHLILEVHDDGSPNLYAYRRVIITAP